MWPEVDYALFDEGDMVLHKGSGVFENTGKANSEDKKVKNETAYDVAEELAAKTIPGWEKLSDKEKKEWLQKLIKK